MKFKYLFALPILATALMGCDEIEMSDAKPVENPQLPGITQEDFKVTPTANMTGVMNLEDFAAKAEDPASYMIDLYSIQVLTENLPESAIVTGGLEFSATPDFAKSFEVGDLSFEDGNCSAPLSSLLSIRNLMYGVDPNSFPVYYRVPVYVALDGGQYRIGGRDYFFCSDEKFDQIGTDPGFKIEDAYYVFGPFIGGNTPNSGVKMYHDDSSLYNNPVFTYTFEVSEEEVESGFTFLIAPESAHNTQGTASECYGAGSEDGSLVLGGSPINVTQPGPYMLEVNMRDLTYILKTAPASLYVIFTGGQFNQVSQLTTGDYVTYEGVAGLTNKWALTGQAAYKPTLYVNNPEVAVDNSLQFTTTGGIMYSDGGAPAANENGIVYSGAGLYYIKANLQELTYESYFCKTMGITGSMEAQDWGTGADIALSSKRSDLYLVWTGTLTVNAGDEWKIRANSDWTINFGAAGDGSYVADGTTHYELAKDGANFVAPETGTYTVTVYFNGMTTDGGLVPYYMTIAPAN